ncbi:MAG: 2-oxoacid:ferredoxin oxidoreductase subunit beta [Acidobacteriota bacterium]
MGEPKTLTRKDFQSDQDVRWCPGCGDYAILKAVQEVMPELGVPKEKLVVVSGIGCSSRFPYYMNTFGFHTIHGRAPAIATGLKLARPDLEVWVVTGDGDALSIGGNHLIHALRRNIGLKILLFNNRIYGLTKGQYSPTSEVGKRTSSSPVGSVDPPFNPLALALGAGASFVARSVDIFQPHLKSTLLRAARHRGTAFIEIYQNCNIFNDGAFAYMTDKAQRATQVLELEHGAPVAIGAGDARRELRLDGLQLSAGSSEDDGEALVWDETDLNLASLMAHVGPPDLPTPIGVLHAHERPAFEDQMARQVAEQVEQRGGDGLDALIRAGDHWTVGPDGISDR